MARALSIRIAAPVAAALLFSACSHFRHGDSDRPIGTPVIINSPLGLPPLPVPPGNPVTAESIALGRRLFYEPKLSADNTLSCASCHLPATGFADARKVSRGVKGAAGVRNAPTVINAAFAGIQFWDGRAASLEDQAGGPMANPVEMNQPHDVSIAKLQQDPSYREAFEKTFGPGDITIGKVEKALASFERTMLSGNSPFDKYTYGGDKTALSAAALRGMKIFADAHKGNCIVCHTIQPSYALFSDGQFHNLGVGLDANGDPIDPGRFAQTSSPSDRGAFKTPSLRNVALTAPYMHDGSLKTLRDVVDFYAGGGNSNPNLDKNIKPLSLTREERDDLVEFLKSLTGELPRDAGPPPTR